MMTYKE